MIGLSGFCYKKEVYHNIIESIVGALDAKDTYTANHSRRVGEMVDLLCSKLKVKKSEKEQIHIAAHIHDIGKIGIPDHILNKGGKLTELEWVCMKKHTRIGANILSRSQYLSEISGIVLYHHERWDGKGYYGLEKKEIPFGARIIAISDSIDAMTSNRPYRNAMTAEECRQEIENNIGLMYDPKIAHVVLYNWEEMLLCGDRPN